MVGRTLILSICGCLLLAGCNQFATRARRTQQAAQTSIPADYSASTKLVLDFASCAKAPKPTELAKLDYKVSGTLDEPRSMELSDAANPKGTVVKKGGYEIHLNTYIGQPKVVDQRNQECLVQGAYTICIVSDSGERIGEFEVDPGGHLVYKGGTSSSTVGVKMISTRDRTLYTIHHRPVSGAPGAAFLGIEFTPGPNAVEHKTVASDGWTYRFDFWDGTLWLHPADHMGDMPQELQLRAEAEEKDRETGDAYKPVWVDGSGSVSFSGGCG
jgi:hypothetical protein